MSRILLLRCRSIFVLVVPVLLGVALMSCGSNKPNQFRVLTSIAVTPQSADAGLSDGPVPFSATGAFSLPPLSGPVSFAAPYTGQFSVDDASIATVVASGPGTVTVQCVQGASGTANVVASAAANNGTNTVVSGSGQLTCP